MSVTGSIMAGVGLAGSVGSAVIGSKAAKNAANAQVDAANHAADLQHQDAQSALDFQRQQWLQSQRNMYPWLRTGSGAAVNLANLLGVLPPDPGSGGSPNNGFGNAAPSPNFARGAGSIIWDPATNSYVPMHPGAASMPGPTGGAGAPSLTTSDPRFLGPPVSAGGFTGEPTPGNVGDNGQMTGAGSNGSVPLSSLVNPAPPGPANISVNGNGNTQGPFGAGALPPPSGPPTEMPRPGAIPGLSGGGATPGPNGGGVGALPPIGADGGGAVNTVPLSSLVSPGGSGAPANLGGFTSVGSPMAGGAPSGSNAMTPAPGTATDLPPADSGGVPLSSLTSGLPAGLGFGSPAPKGLSGGDQSFGGGPTPIPAGDGSGNNTLPGPVTAGSGQNPLTVGDTTDPTAGISLGSLVNPNLGAAGSLFQGWQGRFIAPDDVTEQFDPGFQFRMKQGQTALENSAAARGGLLSGGTAKALDRYNQDYASNEYGNVYNRSLGEYQQSYNQFEQSQADKFNRLASLAGMGQVSAGQLNSAGQMAAGNVGNILMQSGQQIGNDYIGAGNARASGYVGSANAINGAIGGAANSISLAALLSQYGQR